MQSMKAIEKPVLAETPGENRQTLAVTISYEQARRVIWPFRRLNRPIGALFDEGVIAPRDLGWASLAPNLDIQIKEAARTILAHHWSTNYTHTSSQQSGPNVVYGSKYLQRMERAHFGAALGLLGFTVGLLVHPVLNTINYVLTKGATLAQLIVVVLLFAAGAWLAFREVSRYLRISRNYTEGKEGENAVAERMLAVLDGRWTIFRNWKMPGRRDDIDIILVGPGGVFAIEVKTYSSGVRMNSSPVDSGRKGMLFTRWTGVRRSPNSQSVGNAVRLRELLNQKGVHVGWVAAVLAFPTFSPIDLVPDQWCNVWYMVDIDEKLTRVNANTALSDAQIQNTINIIEDMNVQR